MGRLRTAFTEVMKQNIKRENNSMKKVAFLKKLSDVYSDATSQICEELYEGREIKIPASLDESWGTPVNDKGNFLTKEQTKKLESLKIIKNDDLYPAGHTIVVTKEGEYLHSDSTVYYSFYFKEAPEIILKSEAGDPIDFLVNILGYDPSEYKEEDEEEDED